jgi:FecR protein
MTKLVRYFLAAAVLAGAAHAEEKIGLAIIVRNDVNGVLSERTVRIAANDDVFGKEIVKTGQESSAKLVFADSTNLAVGPNASVTLDEFVFAGPTDYKKAVLTLVKGSFRFMTGISDKRAYEIKTKVATIGIRGTVGDILSLDRETIVTVQSGVMRACSRASYRCTMVHAGETAIITARSAANQAPSGPNSFIFNCAADPSLCEASKFAELTPDLTPYLVGAAALVAVGAGIAAGVSNGHGVSSSPFVAPPLPATSPKPPHKPVRP